MPEVTTNRNDQYRVAYAQIPQWLAAVLQDHKERRGYIVCKLYPLILSDLAYANRSLLT